MDKSKMPLPGAPTLPSLDRPLSSLPIVQDAVRRVANSLPNHLWPGSGSGGDRWLTPAPTPNLPSPTDASKHSQTHQRANSATSLSNLPLSNHFQKQARKMQVMRSSVFRHKAFAQRVASTLLEEAQSSSGTGAPSAAIVRDPSPLRQHVERRPVPSSCPHQSHAAHDVELERRRGRHTKTSLHDSNLWLPPATHASRHQVDFESLEGAAADTSSRGPVTTTDRSLNGGNVTSVPLDTRALIPLNPQDLLKSDSIKVIQAKALPTSNWRPAIIFVSSRSSMNESLSVTKE